MRNLFPHLFYFFIRKGVILKVETKQVTNKTIAKIYQDSDFSKVREKYKDPGTKYAFSVMDGKTQAGYMMQLACLRHLRDLKHQGNSGFPYRYDLAEAGKVLKFAKICPNVDTGQPTALMPWQEFLLSQSFGWRNETGGKRFSQVKGKRTFRLFLCVSLTFSKDLDYLTKIIW